MEIKVSLRGRRGDRSHLSLGIVCFVILFLAMTAFAESPDVSFKQGNEAYAASQYAQAITSYEAARSQGLHHWVLYYDLGNAYYKSGSLGKAVANYLRAFRLNSSQKDVIYNLHLALTRAGDPLIPQEALARLFWRAFYFVPLNVLTVASSLLLIGLCGVGALGFLQKIRLNAEPLALTFGVFVLLGTWTGMRISIAEKQQGVIVSGIAEVRSSPNLSDAANFTVPEGRRVVILKEQEPINGWIEIGVPQEGLKGWIPDSSVEAI